MIKVRLIRKLADVINGVDLTRRAPGDVFEIPGREAELLIAEGWAIAHDDGVENRHNALDAEPTPAARERADHAPGRTHPTRSSPKSDPPPLLVPSARLLRGNRGKRRLRPRQDS